MLLGSHIYRQAVFLCNSLPKGPYGDKGKNVYFLNSNESLRLERPFLNVHFKDRGIVCPADSSSDTEGMAKLNEFQLLKANIQTSVILMAIINLSS